MISLRHLLILWVHVEGQNPEFRKNIIFWTAKSRRKNNSVSNTSNSVIHWLATAWKVASSDASLCVGLEQLVRIFRASSASHRLPSLQLCRWCFAGWWRSWSGRPRTWRTWRKSGSTCPVFLPSTPTCAPSSCAASPTWASPASLTR